MANKDSDRFFHWYDTTDEDSSQDDVMVYYSDMKPSTIVDITCNKCKNLTWVEHDARRCDECFLWFCFQCLFRDKDDPTIRLCAECGIWRAFVRDRARPPSSSNKNPAPPADDEKEEVRPGRVREGGDP